MFSLISHQCLTTFIFIQLDQWKSYWKQPTRIAKSSFWIRDGATRIAIQRSCIWSTTRTIACFGRKSTGVEDSPGCVAGDYQYHTSSIPIYYPSPMIMMMMMISLFFAGSIGTHGREMRPSYIRIESIEGVDIKAVPGGRRFQCCRVIADYHGTRRIAATTVRNRRTIEPSTSSVAPIWHEEWYKSRYQQRGHDQWWGRDAAYIRTRFTWSSGQTLQQRGRRKQPSEFHQLVFRPPHLISRIPGYLRQSWMQIAGWDLCQQSLASGRKTHT